jgi:hypothetical protein
MTLPHHSPDQLPVIAYAYPAGTELPDPNTFRRIRPQPPEHPLNRPQGGLWCAPVRDWHRSGEPAATDWTIWCNAPERIVRPWPHENGNPYDMVVTIEPLPEAQVYRIDTQEDLNLLVEEYPVPDWTFGSPKAPNWEALVVDGTDAVFVSAEGLAANEDRHILTDPSLYGWDCPSVLWLRGTYQLGAQGVADPEAR